MTERLAHSTRLHQQIWELLPWYANGTLDSEEGARVEAHLAICPDCQVELTRCHAIAAAVHEEREGAWSPSPDHFRELLAQIDTAEARETANRNRWARLWDRVLRSWLGLRETPRPARWALALQGALVLVLATALVRQTVPPAPPYYQTLSSEEKSAPVDPVRVRLMFVEDITEKELRALLISLGAAITEGPSSTGVYTVALSPPARDLKVILARLRAHPKVRFAEPVSPRLAP